MSITSTSLWQKIKVINKGGVARYSTKARVGEKRDSLSWLSLPQLSIKGRETICKKKPPHLGSSARELLPSL
jgi:hypothetical protein